MRNVGVIAWLLSISLIACNDNISATDVPSVVLNSFKSKFPKATKIEWEKIDTHYEADFVSESIDRTAQLNIDGKLIMQKKEIDPSNLPPDISHMLKKRFHSYLTDDTEWVEKDGIAYYQVELESTGKPDQKLVLTSDGIESPFIPYWE